MACAEADRREFNYIVHSWTPKKVSILFNLKKENKNTEPVKVWSGLWLRTLPLGHVKVKDGIFAYSLQFSTDKEFKNIVLSKNQPGHGITADVIAGFHFRNKDNTGPNEIGPKNVNAPQEYRYLTYKDFEVEIRILNFKIIGIESGVIPAFSNLDFLVSIEETNNIE